MFASSSMSVLGKETFSYGRAWRGRKDSCTTYHTTPLRSSDLTSTSVAWNWCWERKGGKVVRGQVNVSAPCSLSTAALSVSVPCVGGLPGMRGFRRAAGDARIQLEVMRRPRILSERLTSLC